MAAITIQCPEEVLISLKEDPKAFGKDLILAAAKIIYELGRLSSGRSAKLAGLSGAKFLQRAAEFKVPAWDLMEGEFKRDMRHAGNCGTLWSKE
jgi:hypothetical protein